MTTLDHDCREIDALAAPEPKILWVELTSKCPFRCTFCSRELLRGDGEHLDFAVFSQLIADLQRPEIIRLQVAGESMHYPHLIEAIRLAKRTGATLELTSTVASMPETLMRDVLTSGLDLLTVSVHTTDPEQYREIYGFSSFANLRTKLARLVALKRELGLRSPVIDFSFVAMRRNLHQLPAVAQFATEMQVDGINVLRVLRAEPNPEPFAEELEDNHLTPAFKADLMATVAETRSQFPGLRVALVNNASEDNDIVTTEPRYHAGQLPPGARIATCIENPWETIHVFADGETYACCFGGLRAEYAMGNLHSSSIRQIWSSPRYRAYRQRYAAGQLDICQRCCWKKAHYPTSTTSRYLATQGPSAHLVRGFYDTEPGLVWSKADCTIKLARPVGARELHLVGMLPSAPGLPPVTLTLRANGVTIGTIHNASGGPLDIDARLPLPDDGAASVMVSVHASREFAPHALGLGPDRRRLGFALYAVEVVAGQRATPLSFGA